MLKWSDPIVLLRVGALCCSAQPSADRSETPQWAGHFLDHKIREESATAAAGCGGNAAQGPKPDFVQLGPAQGQVRSSSGPGWAGGSSCVSLQGGSSIIGVDPAVQHLVLGQSLLWALWLREAL